MRAYLIRRLLLIMPSFIGISLVTFVLIQSVPGSPVYMRLLSGQGEMRSDAATKEIIEQTKKLYGLDKPIPVQYALWLKRMVTLDFGDSYKDHRPVLEKIAEALPVTLQISLISIFIAYLVAIPLGVYSATHPHGKLDMAFTILLFLLFSLPTFWVAILLIMFLGGGNYWNVFPVHGLNSLGAESYSWPRWLADRAWHLLLPTFCYTYGSLAALSRYMRSGMIDVIGQDYIRTARAYGFRERTIVYRHAMRNALIPMLTVFGEILPSLIGGAVIIEYIFSLPGMGRLMFEAMLSRDYPLVMGEITCVALLTFAGLILSDVLYALADPRIKLG